MMYRVRVLIVPLMLRLSVHIGDIGRGLRVLAGLLSMSQEILKILDYWEAHLLGASASWRGVFGLHVEIGISMVALECFVRALPPGGGMTLVLRFRVPSGREILRLPLAWARV